MFRRGGPLAWTRWKRYGTNSRRKSSAWSPEGGRLAFIRQLPNHAAGIFSVPVPGTGEQKWAELPQGFDDLPHLDWSPDGQTFLSGQRDSATGPSYLVSVSLANGEKRKLTSPPPGELGDSFGMFSPDGRRIAFRRTRSNGVEDVWLIPSTGGEARRVTFDNRGISGIAWAANGGSLILSSRRTSTLRNLWRLWLDRGTMERLQPASVDAGSPAVSRRGRRLVYVVSAIDIDCWRFPTGGGTPERIVSSTAGESSPQFSPDGSRIAFVSDRSGTSEIWIANSDGSAPLRLTNSGATGAGGAQWSPDGRYLTFNASPDHNNDVFVISAGSKELRRITAEPSNESAPSWSRDGKWIYFSSNRSGTPSIWRAPAAGGPAERVTTALSGFPLESPDGKFIYYARQSSSCSVLRQPLNPSGSEEKVFDYPGRILGNYTLGAQGIYFICVDSHDEAGLWYHDLALGTRRLLHTLTKSPVAGAAGMSLSSDGRWVSYAEVEHSTRDIYLVDNFR
jgi:Tol biopolymer transport system component